MALRDIGKEATYMSSQRPDPRAEVRALIALITDEAVREPDRKPRPYVVRWFADLASAVGLTPRLPGTVAELMRSAMALRVALDAGAATAATREPATPAPAEAVGEPVVVDLRRAVAG